MFDRTKRDQHDAMDNRAFGLGILLGAALGAGAALLMAPSSGDETRRQLRKSARRLYARSGDTLTNLWEEADGSARRLSRRGLKQGRKVVSRVRDRARDVAPW